MLRRSAVFMSALVALTSSIAAVDFNTYNLSSDSSSIGTARAADSNSDDTTSYDTSVPYTQSAQISFEHIQTQIRNGQVRSRGVNLGGWLVAENWMTAAADFWRGVSADDASAGEYTAITQAKSPATIRSNLANHHATFITETEIAAIAAAGLNTVRVPVGYWIVGFDNDDPSDKGEWKAFTKGTLKYLDLLIKEWAKKHNIAVLISIHAAKGSQNGADHSSPSTKGKAYWSDFSENVQNTISMATFLANRYKDEAAFLGIGLLNEPNGSTDEKVLYQYYQDAYKAIRDAGNDCVLSVAPLLWKQNPDTMTDFMQAPAYKNVWVEWHPYFVWGYEQTSESDLINVAVKTNFQGDVTKWNSRASHNRLFIGEWSFATAGKFGNSQEQYYEFIAAQVNVMNQAEGGYTFWSWRIYGDESGYNGWSLRSALRDERIKQIMLPNSGSSQQQS
ncbi:Glucan 1,3-beta-glucosidase, partial [Globisporangium splendens]